jgi:hypothetical protein
LFFFRVGRAHRAENNSDSVEADGGTKKQKAGTERSIPASSVLPILLRPQKVAACFSETFVHLLPNYKVSKHRHNTMSLLIAAVISSNPEFIEVISELMYEQNLCT